MEELVFKGGTALRKLYAGSAGRFSLDLDFSVRDIGTSADDVLDLFESHVAGLHLGPFTYGIAHRRGKRHLLMASAELGSLESLSSKLDVSAPPWLPPVERGWSGVQQGGVRGQHGERVVVDEGGHRVILRVISYNRLEEVPRDDRSVDY